MPKPKASSYSVRMKIRQLNLEKIWLNAEHKRLKEKSKHFRPLEVLRREIKRLEDEISMEQNRITLVKEYEVLAEKEKACDIERCADACLRFENIVMKKLFILPEEEEETVCDGIRMSGSNLLLSKVLSLLERKRVGREKGMEIDISDVDALDYEVRLEDLYECYAGRGPNSFLLVSGNPGYTR
jgi:hypothetical protein